MGFGHGIDMRGKAVANHKLFGLQSTAVTRFIYTGIFGLVFIIVLLEKPQQFAVTDRIDGSQHIPHHSHGSCGFKRRNIDIIRDGRVGVPVRAFGIGFMPCRHQHIGILISIRPAASGLCGKDHCTVLAETDCGDIFAHLASLVADIRESIVAVIAADGEPCIVFRQSQAGFVFHRHRKILFPLNKAEVGHANCISQNCNIIGRLNFLIDWSVNIINAHYRIPLLLLLFHKIIFDHQPTCLFPETSLLFSPSPSKRSVIKTDYINNRIIYRFAKVNAF